MKKIFKDLTGKTVLITGASSGLGEAIAYEAAKRHAKLILCARREDKLKVIAEKCIRLSNESCDYFSLDVSDFNCVEETLSIIETNNPKVDVLVNCAGFGLFEPFLETDIENTMKMFKVNVLGLMYLTQKIAIRMAEDTSGHIINIGSQAGKMATPKSSIYAATKFAVIGFSNSLRLELKPLGIAVTTVNPGPIKTNFFETADPSGDYLATLGKVALDPDKLAKKVVNIMGTDKREINAPFIMELGSKSYQLFPHIGDYLASTLFNKK